jgi:hypothetical protein
LLNGLALFGVAFFVLFAQGLPVIEDRQVIVDMTILN